MLRKYEGLSRPRRNRKKSIGLAHLPSASRELIVPVILSLSVGLKNYVSIDLKSSRAILHTALQGDGAGR